MSRAAIAVLAALVAASAHAAAARRHVDPDAIREARRAAGERYASPRAISHYLEARHASRSGDLVKVIEHLKLAVSYDQASPELAVSLADALAEAGQLDAAEAEARRALDLDGHGVTAAEAHVLLGRLAAARSRPEEAARSLGSAIQLERALAAEGERADPEPWRLLAGQRLDAGDEDGAFRTLEDLAAILPGDGSAFREIGRLLLEKREAGRAERYLRRAAQLDGRDLEALRLLAQAHEALRREPEARDDLLAILRVAPDDERALLALGRMAVRQGDVPAAREWFHRYVRSAPDPAASHVRVVFQWLEVRHGAEALAAARAGMADSGTDPRLRFAEGLALQELRRWSESADALAAVRVESGELFVSARVALADSLSRAGRHAEAEKALEAPLAAHPRDVRLITTRASVLARAGRPGDAVAVLRRAIAERERAGIQTDLPELYAALADGLARAGRPAEAIPLLRGALSSRPRDEDLLFALGAAYERAGEMDLAVAQMRALLAVNPDHAEAMNFVGYAYAEQGVRLEDAERLVRRALELKPRSGHILDSLGWVLFRRGDARRAVEVLEQADALAGPDPTILEHLGDAYRANARPSNAAQAYRRALATVGEDELPGERGKRRASLQRKLRELSERAER
jgi:tetratricopeptide (TPR) repeat protein